MDIFTDVTFEAARHLPKAPEGHKCRRLHGHSFRARFTVSGPLDAEAGWVIDFDRIAAAVDPVIARLDYHTLNDIEGLDNPTTEMLTRWIWRQAKPLLPELTELTVWETPACACVYRGEED